MRPKIVVLSLLALCLTLTGTAVWADEGDLLWFDGRIGENLEATPAVDSAGNIYVAADDDMWSFDAQGTLRWHYEHPGNDAVFGESSSPALGPDGATVYLACYAGVFAFRAADGELLWQRLVPADFPHNFATTPALSADGSRLYVGAGDNLNPSDLFYCLDSADGSVIWTYDNPHPPQARIRGYLGGASVGADGTVYVASQHGWLISLTDNGDDFTENWARVVGNECRMPPAIDGEGFVYVGAGTGELRKFDGETGQEVTSGGWPNLLGGEIFVAQAIGADGTIYTGNENEKVYAFNPDGTLQWSYDELASWPTDPLVRADGAILFTADIEGEGASVICLNPNGTLKWSTPFISTVVLNETNLNITPGGTLVEMLVKVLNGCDVTDHFWVFASATTDVEYTPAGDRYRDGGRAAVLQPAGGGGVRHYRHQCVCHMSLIRIAVCSDRRPGEDMEQAVQIFAVVHLVTMGLSHVLQPRAWVAFFLWLREKGEAGVFATAFLSLGFGSIIVAFHNVWSGIPMVLTLFGWAQVLKALIYFVSPSFGLRKLHLISEERAKLFVAPGVFMLALAGLLVYHMVTDP